MNKYRILHILPDEKVIDTFIEMLEHIFPNENLFLIIKPQNNLLHVKTKNNTIYMSPNSSDFLNFIKDLNTYKEVVLHGILDCKYFSKIVHPNISWVIWGADMYELLLYPRGYKLYFDDERQWKIRAQKYPIWLYKLLCKIRDKKKYDRSRIMLKKISNFYAIRPDYDLLCNYFPECSNKRVATFSYYPLEKMINSDNMDKFVSGTSIWVNNCAKQNGNHIEVFEALKKVKLDNSKVYCPLSYGDKRFANYLIKYGENLFNKDFLPMLDFIPREKYYNYFYDVNSFIYGHLRQCAEGNIMVSLYVGGKCFLYKKNPLYSYFKELGCEIYSIDDDLTIENLRSPLSAELRLKNREIVKSISSEINVMKNLKEVFQ